MGRGPSPTSTSVGNVLTGEGLIAPGWVTCQAKDQLEVFDLGERTYQVVINHELQYSIWPLSRPLPWGWVGIDFRGSKEACLQKIEAVWVDMRPTSVRIQAERRQPVWPLEAAPIAAQRSRGYKVTDHQGYAFYCKTEAFRLEHGKVIQVEAAQPGLHFSPWIEDAIANGLAASIWDARYGAEVQASGFASRRLHGEGICLFEVEATEARPTSASVWQARQLRVLSQVSPHQSHLWKLVGDHLEALGQS